MPRIRYIKPEFFTDEHIAELNYEQRLIFIGLWCYSDKRGRLEDRPKFLKIALSPYDNVDIDEVLSRLSGGDKPFISRYETDGKKYIQVLNFEKHQKPHHTEKDSIIPELKLVINKDNQSIKETEKGKEKGMEMEKQDGGSATSNNGGLTVKPKSGLKETAEQYIVRQYKISLGVPELDKDWDKKRFSYCVKFASGIISAFEGDKKYACDWFDQQLPGWRAWAAKTGGKISIATIEARAWDEKGKYLEEKARREKHQRQEGNYDSQQLTEKMGADYTVGQIKNSDLTQIGEAVATNIHKGGKP